jgi:hypothetical protein
MPRTELRPTIRTSVEARLSHWLVLKEQQRQIEAQLDKLKPEVNADLLKAGPEGIETDDFKAVLIESTNSRIDQDLLLELGVKPSIIRRATKTTPYAYPKVTAKKKNA